METQAGQFINLNIVIKILVTPFTDQVRNY